MKKTILAIALLAAVSTAHADDFLDSMVFDEPAKTVKVEKSAVKSAVTPTKIQTIEERQSDRRIDSEINRLNRERVSADRKKAQTATQRQRRIEAEAKLLERKSKIADRKQKKADNQTASNAAYKKVMNNLFAEAELDIKKYRLSDNDGAIDTYKKIMTKTRKGSDYYDRAKNGMDNVALRYIDLSQANWNKKRWTKAQNYKNKAYSVFNQSGSRDSRVAAKMNKYQNEFNQALAVSSNNAALNERIAKMNQLSAAKSSDVKPGDAVFFDYHKDIAPTLLRRENGKVKEYRLEGDLGEWEKYRGSNKTLSSKELRVKESGGFFSSFKSFGVSDVSDLIDKIPAADDNQTDSDGF